jgi:hypothetical protein
VVSYASFVALSVLASGRGSSAAHFRVFYEHFQMMSILEHQLNSLLQLFDEHLFSRDPSCRII